MCETKERPRKVFSYLIWLINTKSKNNYKLISEMVARVVLHTRNMPMTYMNPLHGNMQFHSATIHVLAGLN